MIVLMPTESEIRLAGHVGLMRFIANLRSTHAQKWGGDDSPSPNRDFFGALGEMMLAKHKNKYWNGRIGNTKVPDVDDYYEVRATDLSTGKLIVKLIDQEQNKGELPFVLAHVLLPEVRLIGWQWGKVVMKITNWRDDVRHPAWFTGELLDMMTLPEKPEGFVYAPDAMAPERDR